MPGVVKLIEISSDTLRHRGEGLAHRFDNLSSVPGLSMLLPVLTTSEAGTTPLQRLMISISCEDCVNCGLGKVQLPAYEY
jgi:hypothetical protein